MTDLKIEKSDDIITPAPIEPSLLPPATHTTKIKMDIISPLSIKSDDSLIDRIDKNMAKYYATQDKNYFNEYDIGKFAQWCEDNAYDEELVMEELQMNPSEDDIFLLDFDDEFPVIDDMWDVLQSCTQEAPKFNPKEKCMFTMILFCLFSKLSNFKHKNSRFGGI